MNKQLSVRRWQAAALGLMMLILAGRAGAQLRAADWPVQPGDRFVVRLSGDSISRQAVTVDDRLAVELPLAGRVAVGGLSARAATDSVRARLLGFRREGGIGVTFERRIAVLGDVRRPDLYYMDLSVHLRSALAMAGGVSETGRTSEVVLLRDGTQTRIRDWRATGAGDMELRSGDELVVPRERWIARNAMTFVSATGIVASIMVAIMLR